MRTLVISDLHLGARRGRAILHEPEPLAALAGAVGGYDRLVLLGDIIELRQLLLKDALAAASRVLPQLVAGTGADTEIWLLAGNHDHELLAPWFARRRSAAGSDAPPPLQADTEVDWVAGEPLAQVAEMLSGAGATVRAFYPGAWLREDVYAHHGHYLDRHTTTPGFERIAAGAMGRMLKLGIADMSSVDDYERLLAPIYAWMHAITETGGPEVDSSEEGGSTRILRRVNESGGLEVQAWKWGLKAITAAVGATGIGPLSGDITFANICREGLLAYGQVLATLGLEPAYAIFGHTHRAGPLPVDDSAGWSSPAGTRILNCGCWVQEGAAFGATVDGSPYRAGFAIELDESGPPRLVNLLER